MCLLLAQHSQTRPRKLLGLFLQHKVLMTAILAIKTCHSNNQCGFMKNRLRWTSLPTVFKGATSLLYKEIVMV